MINIETGLITFNSLLKVDSNMEFSELNIITNDFKKEYTDLKNGWEWIRLRNIITNTFDCFVSIAFYNKKLTIIEFGIEKNYRDWNFESEKELKVEHDLWLSNSIGKNRIFSWGKIESQFDAKGGYSSIILNYN